MCDISAADIARLETGFTNECRRHITDVWRKYMGDKPFPEIEINWRMRTTAGRAYLRKNKIKLNGNIYLRIPAAERKNTNIHEVAHLIAYLIHGDCGHGYWWKQIMRSVGETPTRCHNYDIKDLKRKKKRYYADCACRVHSFSLTLYRRIFQGKQYRCRYCGCALRKETLRNVRDKELQN